MLTYGLVLKQRYVQKALERFGSDTLLDLVVELLVDAIASNLAEAWVSTQMNTSESLRSSQNHANIQ